ncbi:unnamed protein product, partial [Cuscuta epithymum]
MFKILLQLLLTHGVLTPAQQIMSRLTLVTFLFTPITPVMKGYKLVMDLQGQTLLTGRVENGLYHLQSSPTAPSSPRVYLGEKTSLQTWHHRFGHPHESVLRRLVSRFNLPISSNKLSSICESCQLEKSHRLS